MLTASNVATWTVTPSTGVDGIPTEADFSATLKFNTAGTYTVSNGANTKTITVRNVSLAGPTAANVGTPVVYTFSVSGVPTSETLTWAVTAADGSGSVTPTVTAGGSAGQYNVTFPAAGTNLVLVATDSFNTKSSVSGITVATPSTVSLANFAAGNNVEFMTFIDYVYVNPSYTWATKAGSTFTTPVTAGSTVNDNDGNCLFNIRVNGTTITANNIELKSIGAITTVTRPVTDTNSHTAYVYVGCYKGTGTLTASLNGTNATLVINPTQLGNFKQAAVLTYQSGTPSGTLTISQNLTAQGDTNWGLGLQAVAISN